MSTELSAVDSIEVTLVGGGGGIFEVRKGGDVIWKKERGGAFPEVGEIIALLGCV